MESLNTQLRVVKQKFPGQNDRIEYLYEVDEDFRTLCSDYLLCVRHLEAKTGDVSESQHALQEYKEILDELERELNGFIFNKQQ